MSSNENNPWPSPKKRIQLFLLSIFGLMCSGQMAYTATSWLSSGPTMMGIWLIFASLGTGVFSTVGLIISTVTYLGQDD